MWNETKTSSPQTCITVQTVRLGDASVTLLNTQKPNPTLWEYLTNVHTWKQTHIHTYTHMYMLANACLIVWVTMSTVRSSQDRVLSGFKGNSHLLCYTNVHRLYYVQTYTEDLKCFESQTWTCQVTKVVCELRKPPHLRYHKYVRNALK